MSFVTISIFSVLMCLTICGVNIRGGISNAHQSDPYKISGLWYVVATIGYDANSTQPICRNVAISMSSPTSFIGFFSYFDKIKGKQIGGVLQASKSGKYLYPNIFDVSMTPTKNIVQVSASKMILYKNYLYDYSIWHWEDSAGNGINSFVVNRNPNLSQEEYASLLRFYPKVKLMDSSTGCSANVDDTISSNVASSDDPFNIKGTWYVAAYATSSILSFQFRCWIVNLSSSNSSLYTGTSAHSIDETNNRIISHFKAEQFKNWTYVVKFHVTISNDRNQMTNLWVVPYESYIYNYSIWASYAKSYFDYLVVSRNQILSEEEIVSLGGTKNGLTYVDNTRSTCSSGQMELPQPGISVSDEATRKSTINEEDVVMNKLHNPSRARRLSVTIPIFVLSSMVFIDMYSIDC